MKSILLSLLLLVSFSCKHAAEEDQSQSKGLVTENPTYDDINKYRYKDFFFIINLHTNKLTVLRKGVVTDQWNIATGDVSGGNHNGISKYTPQGLFTVNEIIHCPKWMPSDVKNDEGVVPETWEEKVAIFEKYPSVYGPCGENNPLGQTFIWFYKDYGMHGNSDESVLKRQNPADRAVSGGCIRNPNILVNRLLNAMMRNYRKEIPGMKNFMSMVKASRRLPVREREEIILDVRELEIPVLIGSWARDLNLN